jgi:hypothetical protein
MTERAPSSPTNSFLPIPSYEQMGELEFHRPRRIMLRLKRCSCSPFHHLHILTNAVLQGVVAAHRSWSRCRERPSTRSRVRTRATHHRAGGRGLHRR